VVHLHRLLIESSGGPSRICDLGLLDSALAQPRATFDGRDLHPTIEATTDEQELLTLGLDLAAGLLRREDLAAWLENHTVKPGPDVAVRQVIDL
jgi:prophage maintenance system killer protein